MGVTGSVFTSGKSGEGVRLASRGFEIGDTGRRLGLIPTGIGGTDGTGDVGKACFRREIAEGFDPEDAVRVEREETVGEEPEGARETEDVARERTRARALETDDSASGVVVETWMTTDGSAGLVVVDDFRALL